MGLNWCMLFYNIFTGQKSKKKIHIENENDENCMHWASYRKLCLFFQNNFYSFFCNSVFIGNQKEEKKNSKNET